MTVCQTQEEAAYEDGEHLQSCVDGSGLVEAGAGVFDFELNLGVNKPNAETNYHYRFHSFRNPLNPPETLLLDSFNFMHSNRVHKS